MNSCVGHRNHRYFFLFMCFIWVGCLYLLIMAWPLFFAEVAVIHVLVARC